MIENENKPTCKNNSVYGITMKKKIVNRGGAQVKLINELSVYL